MSARHSLLVSFPLYITEKHRRSEIAATELHFYMIQYIQIFEERLPVSDKLLNAAYIKNVVSEHWPPNEKMKHLLVLSLSFTNPGILPFSCLFLSSKQRNLSECFSQDHMETTGFSAELFITLVFLK